MQSAGATSTLTVPAATIDSDGNVQIGTTLRHTGYGTTFTSLTLKSETGDNASILELVGNRSANPGNQNSMIQFFYNDAGSATEVGRITSLQGTDITSGSISMHTRGSDGETERLRITEAGYVGIGTTNPTVKLEVNGSIMAGSPASSYVQLSSGGDPSLILHSSGNPNEGADIYYDSSAEDLYIGTRYTTNTFIAFKTGYQDNNIVTNGTEHLRIRQDGYVGIGTTDPANALHVYTADEAPFRIESSDNLVRMALEDDDSVHYIVAENGKISLGVNSTNATSNLTILDSGYIGIGHTAPSTPLAIYNSAQNCFKVIGSNATQTYSVIGNTSTGDAFMVFDASNGDVAGADYSGIGQHNNLDGFWYTSTGAGNIHLRPKDGAGTVIISGSFETTGQSQMTGNVTMSGDLFVDGYIRSTNYKAFYIPTPNGGKLEHMALEGPDPEVYFRGSSDCGIIDLPDYWKWLVYEDSITVQVTPKKFKQSLFVERIEDNVVYVSNGNKFFNKNNMEYDFIVHGKRKDMDEKNAKR